MGHAYPGTKRWRTGACKHCGGDLYFVEDSLETYWECLQCDRHQEITDSFADIPKRDKRWRIDLNYLRELSKTGR